MQAGLLKTYLFTDIPGSGKGWTLGVTATSQKDARHYIDAVHGSGKYIGIYSQGPTVKEDSMICGAVTNAAKEIIHNRRVQSIGKDY
jgi:hypothetical protein